MGVPLKVEFDDGETVEDVFLLNAIANGKVYGGGYKAAPLAEVDDGILDVCLVRKLTRMQIIKLIGIYKNGNHLTDERLSKFVIYKKCRKVVLTTKTSVKISIDGEVEQAERVEFEAIPMAFNFLAPEVIK
jgi:diacylglycerol kinase family enzyme